LSMCGVPDPAYSPVARSKQYQMSCMGHLSIC
jgi:hypothetical protein